MRNDIYGQIILNETDLCDLFLKDPDRILTNVLVESGIQLSDLLDIKPIIGMKTYLESDKSIEDFDKSSQNIWHMPKDYMEMDIAKFVLEQCKNDEELQRAGHELLLFQERDMFDLLKYLKYLVDIMRENNIVWGVGRGSSVSSFVLYLIGIHRINSLYYDLDIQEFLK